MSAKLTGPDIATVINGYIGVSGGYLGGDYPHRFTYASHEAFYSDYCDLSIDLDQHRQPDDTTRTLFTRVLREASPQDQAKILRGILAKYPPDTSQKRTKLAPELVAMAERLEAAPGVSSPQPKITTDTVERAIRDAETLIAKNGATSGVDRIHTALHGHLIAACDAEKIPYGKDPDLTQLIKLLRKHHPKLQDLGHRAQDIATVLHATGAILDALNPVRNRATVAHPNPKLLDQPEAMLVINAARTILHYLDAKLSS